jgi:DNA repair exonuclease SbcCD ATPase subunit
MKKLIFLLVIPLVCPAEAPSLSPAGKQRLQENLKVLEQNLSDTEKNILASKKNIQTLELEISELAKLESEHLELKKKYTQFLLNAEEELERNRKSIAQLETYQGSSAQAQTKDSQQTVSPLADTDRALREKLERERWKFETQAKIQKVRELEKGLLQNIDSIHSRKGPLQSQLKYWDQKEKSYHKLFSQLQKRKEDTEKLVLSVSDQ